MFCTMKLKILLLRSLLTQPASRQIHFFFLLPLLRSAVREITDFSHCRAFALQQKTKRQFCLQADKFIFSFFFHLLRSAVREINDFSHCRAFALQQKTKRQFCLQADKLSFCFLLHCSMLRSHSHRHSLFVRNQRDPEGSDGLLRH